MNNRIALFLLRLAISPIALALVCCLAWIYSFMLAIVGLGELASGSHSVSSLMIEDFEDILKKILDFMGLNPA